jgi:two-component system response regulator NreC
LRPSVRTAAIALNIQSVMETRIILADDHRMFREGLRSLLRDEAGFQLVGEADDGRTAVEMVKTHSADVVVMDLRMPDLNGIDATRACLVANPHVKVIGLSAYGDDKTITEMLRAGASGYVLKESAFEELVAAIHTVLKDKVYLSPSATGALVADYARRPSADTPTAFSFLSPREREVLQLIAEGKATKEAAAQLHVSVKTVETHRRNLMEKLQVDSVAALTKYAIREGLTSV